ncbi:MAG: energy-coupling factor ABC transporter ATP-binding protein [Armatimonadetes bacterium]|nr:energy-coupling factor ABC transporter ATP-binding protein [Armatimonadota bacterium]
MRLEVERASYSYPAGPLALREVSATFVPEERVGLLGANGSGKSTLARLMNGLLVPASGSVRVGELDTRAHPASRIAGLVGYVFQDPRKQLFCRTVQDEIAFGPHQLGWPTERIQETVARTLRLSGLEPFRSEHPYELPSRYFRRLAWASVLSIETGFLIADEPTASMDADEYRWLIEVLDLLRARSVGVLVITHDVEFAAEHLDRLLVLGNGRLLAQGLPSEILATGLPGLRSPVAARAACVLGLGGDVCNARGLIAALSGEGGAQGLAN